MLDENCINFKAICCFDKLLVSAIQFTALAFYQFYFSYRGLQTQRGLKYESMLPASGPGKGAVYCLCPRSPKRLVTLALDHLLQCINLVEIKTFYEISLYIVANIDVHNYLKFSRVR